MVDFTNITDKATVIFKNIKDISIQVITTIFKKIITLHPIIKTTILLLLITITIIMAYFLWKNRTAYKHVLP